MSHEARKRVIDLLNAKRKSEQEKICRNLTLSDIELADLSIAGRQGALNPYRYACHFSDETPKHLNPGKVDFGAIKSEGVGDRKKALNTIFQFGEERRHVAAHLLYTDCEKYWHLFYFDEKDALRRPNHWKHGPHIHDVSDLYCELPMNNVWSKAVSGDLI